MYYYFPIFQILKNWIWILDDNGENFKDNKCNKEPKKEKNQNVNVSNEACKQGFVLDCNHEHDDKSCKGHICNSLKVIIYI